MSREVTAGESITLIAEFFVFDTDGNKRFIDPDSTPLVSIYDPESDPRDSSTDLVNDAAIYQQAATRLMKGIYSYEYLTDVAIQDTDYWFDMWEATIDGTSGTAHMQFLIIGATEFVNILAPNILVTVVLDSSISDTDGNELGEDYEFSFITVFNPFYSDPKLIRAYAGQWVSAVDDATISLLIYEASKEADLITPRYINKYGAVFLEARKNFTTYSTILRMLELPVNQGGMTKMLGDLLVKREGQNFIDMINRCRQNKQEYAHIVNNAGWVGAGESRPPVITAKGILDPDRKDIGRLWVNPGEAWPVANGQIRQNPYRRHKYDNILRR